MIRRVSIGCNLGAEVKPGILVTFYDLVPYIQRLFNVRPPLTKKFTPVVRKQTISRDNPESFFFRIIRLAVLQ